MASSGLGARPSVQKHEGQISRARLSKLTPAHHFAIAEDKIQVHDTSFNLSLVVVVIVIVGLRTRSGNRLGL